MAEQTLIEHLTDEQRIAVLLRANGEGYDDIAVFMDVTPRRVRWLLDRATKSFPEILDHEKDDNTGKLMRLIYLMGYTDGAVQLDDVPDLEEMTDGIDLLRERAKWLKVRIDNRKALEESLPK